MAIIPKRNLPPDAGKWARWVEDNVGTLLRDIEALRANSRATAQQINATSRAASTVVADVQAQETQATRDREIEQETQAALAQTAENLEQARSDLEDAQEWIDTTGDSLNTRLTDAEQALGDAETALTDLENVQLPALRDRLDDAEYDVKHISGEWITAGTIDTERLNAIEIAAETGQFLDIDVSQLVASEAIISEAVVEKLWADVVRAHKITTDMLIVGSGDNLVPDPYFAADAVGDAWTAAGVVTFQRPSTGPTGRDAAVRLGSSVSTFRSSRMVVTEGDQYRVSFWAGSTGTLAIGRVICDVTFYSADGTALDPVVSLQNTEQLSAGTWTRFEHMVEAPDSAAFMDLTFRRGLSAVLYSLPAVAKATDASLIVDGGIISRHLNVTVPEGGSGVEIVPEGISLISEGSASVQLRTDLPQTIGFIDTNQEYTFSVSPEGDVAANSVAVADSLEYKGTELADLLNQFPRGVMAHTRNITDAIVGDSKARVYAATFRTPPDNRKVRVKIRGTVSGGPPRVQYELRQSTGNSVSATNSLQAYFFTRSAATGAMSFVFDHTRSINEWGWPYDATITLGVFAVCNDAGTATFNASYHQEMIVEDVGPREDAVAHIPWVPSGGGGTGGGNEGETGKRLYTQTFAPTWTRSYRGDNSFYNYQTNRLFSGQYLAANGSLRSMVGFNTSAISSFTSGSGTEMVSGRVYIKNAHTYSSSGATIQLGVHTATSAASTFSEHSSIGSAKFNRGQARWLGLGTALNGFKNGNRGGIVLRAPSFSPSQSYYSYFDAASVRLELTVRK